MHQLTAFSKNHKIRRKKASVNIWSLDNGVSTCKRSNFQYLRDELRSGFNDPSVLGSVSKHKWARDMAIHSGDHYRLSSGNMPANSLGNCHCTYLDLPAFDVS